MPLRFFASLVLAFGTGFVARAAFTPTWTVGTDNGNQSEFEIEGSAGDNFYLENGNYTALGGIVWTRGREPDSVAVDPYGSESPDFIVGDHFIETWCSMLAHCQKRFEGQIGLYKNHEKSGGLGCFTPDNFPVFDVFRDNVFVIADSNHGYKMIGVGKLVAEEICGSKSRLLEPFRFSRYAEGKLHPVSNSPFPWS